jgi:hypothetical protein
MKTRPILEVLLLVGLPAAVLLAGAVTTVLAYQQGFTPLAGAERIIGTR